MIKSSSRFLSSGKIGLFESVRIYLKKFSFYFESNKMWCRYCTTATRVEKNRLVKFIRRRDPSSVVVVVVVSAPRHVKWADVSTGRAHTPPPPTRLLVFIQMMADTSISSSFFLYYRNNPTSTTTSADSCYLASRSAARKTTEFKKAVTFWSS